MTSYRVSRCRLLWRNFTSGFGLGDVTFFRRSMFISIPDIVRITQSKAEIQVFPFWKNKRPPIWNSTFGFDFSHVTAFGMLLCIRLPNFIQFGPPTVETWLHIHFSRWRPWRLTTTSGFLLVDATVFRVKIYQETKFCGHISIRGLNITTSVFEKQTSAISEFYLRFRFWLYRRNRRAILHQSAEFHPNRTIYCGHMTSYRFFKMPNAAAQYYFRFRICWCHCLQKVEVYQQTKFRQHIPIHGLDITTSVFEK